MSNIKRTFVNDNTTKESVIKQMMGYYSSDCFSKSDEKLLNKSIVLREGFKTKELIIDIDKMPENSIDENDKQHFWQIDDLTQESNKGYVYYNTNIMERKDENKEGFHYHNKRYLEEAETTKIEYFNMFVRDLKGGVKNG
jgi:hypothetical protein